MVRALLALCVLTMATAPARADVARDATLCSDAKSSAEVVIEACGGVIADASVGPEIKFAALERRAEAFFAGRGDYQNAVDDATAAIKLQPDNPDAYVLRAAVYLAFNEFDKAIADYGAALMRRPNDAVALAGRANAFVQSGDSARAIADYNEVIRLRPDDAGAIYDRGGAYEKTGDVERAQADYNLAIKLQRDYAGEFPDACFAADAKGERVLANWPACEGDEP
ncbi:MAG: tetratricopeptide repeat protein [Micropepsaceae bacterium]